MAKNISKNITRFYGTIKKDQILFNQMKETIKKHMKNLVFYH